MAKTYAGTSKYLVKINFKVKGIVDKEDIIGAVFGQSEGLLGDEMDLKELQKNGKIGRIDVNSKSLKGTTSGTLEMPSSMDMAQTTLLAAAIETVDKVGPCESEFSITEIEDTRNKKKDLIKSRAQELLGKLMKASSDSTQTLADSLREGARAAKISYFGKEKLPAGPEAESSEEIIIVEGRADVLNLLKNQINNAVAMNGSNIPPTLLEIIKKKTVTLFIDGDRGGELNARKLAAMTKIDYVARAPDGKEVEELTRKELIQALTKKIPAEIFLKPKPAQTYPRIGQYSPANTRYPLTRERTYPSFNRRPAITTERRTPLPGTFTERRTLQRYPQRTPFKETTFEVRPNAEELKTFTKPMEEVKGKMKAKIFDEQMKEVKELPVNQLYEKLDETQKIHAIVMDGIITKRLAEKADKNGVKYIVGAKKGKLENTKLKALTM
jgi:DNA primase